MSFGPHLLQIDPAAETERLVSGLRQTVRQLWRRSGGVVGVSGGVDSATVLILAARAFGPERVVAVLLPEKDSAPASELLARQVAEQCGVAIVVENITPALEGFGCYARRDEAIKRLFPEYEPAAGYRAKLTLPANVLEEPALNFFSVTIVSPAGQAKSRRLPMAEYLQIVAASNFKQRSRMASLYYQAELRNYAVIGTANKNEHDQGFMVKYGDGGVDVQPLLHLYKTQVYQLADYLGVPAAIRQRTPTSDTYSAPQSQEEFFFRLPFETMDLLWYAQEQQLPVAEVAQAMGLTEQQVERAFADFTRKRRTTAYLRAPVWRLADS